LEKLKADLHVHTAEDPRDDIKWNARRMVDEAAARGFRVLAVTNHKSVCYNSRLAGYAAGKGIVLIPGCETEIGGRHVLLLNPPPEAAECRTFDELRRIRREGGSMAVVAPHPFFPSSSSLREWVYRHADVFDAIEWCSFYFKWANFNRFAARASRILNLPLLGSSDCHHPWQINTTYSVLEAEPTVEGVIDAVLKGRCRVVTSPLKLNLFTFLLGLRGIGVPESLTAWPHGKLHEAAK